MAKKEVNITEVVKERLKLGGIKLKRDELKAYMEKADDLGEVEKGSPLEVGYKRCGKCGHAKKYHLFNKNTSNKTGCTGNCKECQKEAAKKSYKKTKTKRKQRANYQENRDAKREAARKYYQENKEKVLKQQKVYHTEGNGKKVMQKAHKKRRELLKANAGVPYTRNMVIKRDSEFIGEKEPICYICGKPIKLDDLHLDHIVPVVMEGADCFTNIACTHKLCNLKREKDARELTSEQINLIKKRSEEYMDQYPEEFKE